MPALIRPAMALIGRRRQDRPPYPFPRCDRPSDAPPKGFWRMRWPALDFEMVGGGVPAVMKVRIGQPHPN